MSQTGNQSSDKLISDMKDIAENFRGRLETTRARFPECVVISIPHDLAEKLIEMLAYRVPNALLKDSVAAHKNLQNICESRKLCEAYKATKPGTKCSICGHTKPKM